MPSPLPFTTTSFTDWFTANRSGVMGGEAFSGIMHPPMFSQLLHCRLLLPVLRLEIKACGVFSYGTLDLIGSAGWKLGTGWGHP